MHNLLLLKHPELLQNHSLTWLFFPFILQECLWHDNLSHKIHPTSYSPGTHWWCPSCLCNTFLAYSVFGKKQAIQFWGEVRRLFSLHAWQQVADREHHHEGVCVLPFTGSPITTFNVLPGIGSTPFGTGHKISPILRCFQKKYQWHLPFRDSRMSSLSCCGWIMHACTDLFHLLQLLWFSHGSYLGRQEALVTFLRPLLSPMSCGEGELLHWGSSPNAILLRSCHFSGSMMKLCVTLWLVHERVFCIRKVQLWLNTWEND